LADFMMQTNALKHPKLDELRCTVSITLMGTVTKV
jgi:hypothetical protein